MYNLDNAAKDFPWTEVTYNAVEPWRERGSNWFNELPEGWGDITYTFLKVATYILERFNIKNNIVIEQVKEKFGTGRFYYIFISPIDHDGNYREFTEFQAIGINIFEKVVCEWETAVGDVCCYCGTTENVQCYGSWIHYACSRCEEKNG